jgi:hypothetical protein
MVILESRSVSSLHLQAMRTQKGRNVFMHCQYNTSVSVLAATIILGLGSNGRGSDWPMWRCDAGHTAASSHELPPTLQLDWSRKYSPRVPVWDDPLNQDMMP